MPGGPFGALMMPEGLKFIFHLSGVKYGLQIKHSHQNCLSFQTIHFPVWVSHNSFNLTKKTMVEQVVT